MKLSKWKGLPVHFIDTSVILGAFSNEEIFYDECRNYLSKVGYKYRGSLSTSVVGEIFIIVEEKDDVVDRDLFFEFFDRIIHRRKINFEPSDFATFDTIREVRGVDYKIEALDSEHLSSAICRNATAFITLDTSLIGNRFLESAFGIKIVHPKGI